MSKQIIVDYIPFEITKEQINESISQNDGRLIVKGVLQRADAKNQNGRIYPRDTLVREVGTVEVLGTPAGNILKELFKSGIKLGISSRGLGSVEEIHESDGHEPIVKVQPDFELIAFDFVSNPSTHGAFLSPTNEGKLNEGVGTRNGVCCHDCKIEDIINDIFRGE